MIDVSVIVPSPTEPIRIAAPPRRSWLRRLATVLLLGIFLFIIVGYVYVTDATRVRVFAEAYLSKLFGAEVSVGEAHLSIFEGLRLSDVKILADGNAFLQAKAIQADYSPRALMWGRIESNRVLVIEPHIRSIENTDAGQWNFTALYRHQSQGSGIQPIHTDPLSHWPLVVLRNARLDFAQTANGKTSDVGSLFLEGQFSPEDGEAYRFSVQSRGDLGGVFPVAEGRVRLDGSQVSAEIRDVKLVNEIKTLLPGKIREFWDRHHLTGNLDRTHLEFQQMPGAPPKVRWRTELSGINATIPAQEWFTAADEARLLRWKTAFTELSGPSLGGSGQAGSMLTALEAPPLELKDVDAVLNFSHDRIEIEKVAVRLDQNRLVLKGSIQDYLGQPSFAVRVEAPEDQPLVLTNVPAYLKSLPWPWQEIYFRFKPAGTATFFIEVAQPAASPKPSLHGELAILDGAFAFDRFPYLADRARGSLLFGSDGQTGDPVIDIPFIKCRGHRGGANENANVEISGRITPLDARAGAYIHITGSGIVNEPSLTAAMPAATRKTLANFDPAGTGALPSFSGNFDCAVRREIGLGKPWLVTTQVQVDNGKGVFKDFPYAVSGVTASLTIYDDYLSLTNVNIPCDGGSASLTGNVFWKKRSAETGEPLVQTDLKLSAQHVDLNRRLLEALPPTKREWVKKIDLGGKIDLAGEILPSAPESDDPEVTLRVKLVDGSAARPGGKARIEGITADASINSSKVEIAKVDGRFADAQLHGHGSIVWNGDAPQVSAAADIVSLRIDDRTIGELPNELAQQVRSMHADGTIDAAIDFDGQRKDPLLVTLRPNGLSMRPEFLPLAFTNVKGTTEIQGQRITLKQLTANIGKGAVAASGEISNDLNSVALSLSGRGIVLDKAALKALPKVVRDAAESASLAGTIAFDCPQLKIITPQSVSKNKARNPEIDFSTKVWFLPADLQLGMAITDLNGVVDLKGSVRDNDLKTLDGSVSLQTLKIAGREVEDFDAVLRKPGDQNILHIEKIEARIAGGNVAGQIDTALSRSDPRFALGLQVRGVKVGELTADTANPIDGQLTASLEMEGKWSDTASRRGRGDILVDGRNMYRIPVIFGLMQVANLSLPNSTPIRQAALRYTLEGPRLIMDQIDLRAKESVMQGSGEMNFDTRTVDMQLSLAGSAADAVPIFGDILKAARQDLLQIRVKGTLLAPKVQANAFNLFSTTVDEVKAGK